MYGLPSDFDPSVFVGRSVASVCYSENTTQIFLDDRTIITIWGSLAHSAVAEVAARTETVPTESSALMRLAGRTVVDASVNHGKNLRLKFDDGQVLECLDDSDQYESYSIATGDKQIIV